VELKALGAKAASRGLRTGIRQQHHPRACRTSAGKLKLTLAETWALFGDETSGNRLEGLVVALHDSVSNASCSPLEHPYWSQRKKAKRPGNWDAKKQEPNKLDQTLNCTVGNYSIYLTLTYPACIAETHFSYPEILYLIT
jgi:hypothetical protein